MTLPAPQLDDRNFQDLVDDAKRIVQRRWPEWSGWTDHNVSDPGVTLIEALAFMIDQLLYRVNRITDKTYVKLLDLIGLTLHPPVAATVQITFRLAAPRDHDVIVPAGTEIATDRTDTTEAVVFRTMAEFTIVSRSLAGVASRTADGDAADRTDALTLKDDIALFSNRPVPGDAFYFGLSDAAPGCLVALRISGDVSGHDIDPDRPPLKWEAFCGDAWRPCEIDEDGTGGFNRPGDILLHVPAEHEASLFARRRAGWIRCVVAEAVPGQQAYGASPRIGTASGLVIGGTTKAIHAQRIDDELLGIAEGSAGQRLALRHFPVVLSDDAEILDVTSEHIDSDKRIVTVSEQWTRVEHFADANPDDRCFTIDAATGDVDLPPAVRDADGSVRHHGSVPPSGSSLRIRSYWCGGGRAGNVGPNTLHRIRGSLPFVAEARNRVAATGGLDGETIEDGKRRGPMMLATRHRAVTATDFEFLTRQAAPEIARVACTDAGGRDPGVVEVLVVPDTTTPNGTHQLAYDSLLPSPQTLERIRTHLDERRVIGTRLVVGPPRYAGVRVTGRVRTRHLAAPEAVERDVNEALYRYLHPVVGGPNGSGWPFGRNVQTNEIHAVIQRVDGVDFIDEVELFAYDVEAAESANEAIDQIEVDATSLVFPYDSQVRAVES